jgi:hypothetical protein
MTPDQRLPLLFWAKVRINPITECWEWQGKPHEGYGRFGQLKAHRVAYAALKEPLDPTRELHHSCENKMCCNPDHLQQLTRAEHQKVTTGALTVLNAAKTHCPQGHPYVGHNIIIEPYGSRRCRECRNARKRRRRQRRE